MQLWYYRHTLASDPASELSRVSTGNQSVLRFKISNLPKAAAGAFELIGPGGPLYAIRDVNKNDLLEIQLTPSKKFVGEFHVCVLDDKELPLLDEAVKKGLHRLKFVRPGKPSYLAILAKPAQEIKPGEGCEFVVEKCELKLSE